MSGTVLNLDFSDPSPGVEPKKDRSNARHRQFVKKRRFLEQKGFLNKKKNAPNLPFEENKNSHPNRRRRAQRSQSGAVFPKFITPESEFCPYPSSSLQTHRPNAKSIRNPAVPPKSTSPEEHFSSHRSVPPPSFDRPLKYVAIDCEMVGTGPKGHCSELARCSVVSYDGDVIYDKFIKPVNPVTDLRTRWSGVRWQDLCNATPFIQAQKEIVKILSGKVVVGHAIQNDFKVLRYSHPAFVTRDTSRIPILNKKAGLPEKQPAALKTLTKILLKKDIQVGRKGHSSVEDAKATMELYKIVEVEWEMMLDSSSATIFQNKTG